MQKGLCMDLETEINTEQEIAEYLDVTLACLRDWRSRKVGPPYIKLGRLVRYRRKDVLSWLESQASRSGHPENNERPLAVV
jgi:predicted DNA-binding transcriptional regulator AlpA